MNLSGTTAAGAHSAISLSAKAAALLAAVYGASEAQAGHLVPTDPDPNALFSRSLDFRLDAGGNSMNGAPDVDDPNKSTATVLVPGAGTNTLTLNGTASMSRYHFGIGYGGKGDLLGVYGIRSFRLSGDLSAPITISSTAGTGPATALARTNHPSAGDFVTFRIDPIMTQQMGDLTTLFVTQAHSSSGSAFGVSTSGLSGTANGFTFNAEATLQVRINGVAQPAVTPPPDGSFSYPVQIGDTVGVRLDSSLTLQSTNNTVGAVSNDTFSRNANARVNLETASTPGANKDHPLFSNDLRADGTHLYPPVRVPAYAEDSAGGVVEAWIGLPKASTLYFAVADDAQPDLASLLVPYAEDADGYRISALVGGVWQTEVGTSYLRVTLPDGTRAVRISDIEYTGTDFRVGLSAALPSDNLLLIASANPIPEPSALALVAIGAGGLLSRRGRRKASLTPH